MGTQGTGRKRNPNKDRSTAEEDALNLIAREAEARLAAKRAARAEAREIRMKELERQQKEISDDDERMSVGSRGSVRAEDRDYLEKGSRAASALTAATLTSLGGTSSRRGSGETALTADTETSIREIKDALVEVEEKYRKAMVSNAQLDNEKNNLMYQVDTLKDSLMELEELLTESRREYEEKAKDHEREKHAHSILQFQFTEMKETLKQSEELLNKHGIVLGPDLTVNGEIAASGTDELCSGESNSRVTQDSQTPSTEGSSMLDLPARAQEIEMRSSRNEEMDPEKHQQSLEEANENHLSSPTPCSPVSVTAMPTCSAEQTRSSTADSCVGEDNVRINCDMDITNLSSDTPVNIIRTEENETECDKNNPLIEMVECSDIDTKVRETKPERVDSFEEPVDKSSCDRQMSLHELPEEQVKGLEECEKSGLNISLEGLCRDGEDMAENTIKDGVLLDDIIPVISKVEPQQENEDTEDAENEKSEDRSTELVSMESQPQEATASGRKKKKKKRGKKKKGGIGQDETPSNEARDGSTTELKTTAEKGLEFDVKNDDPAEAAEFTRSAAETLKELLTDEAIDEQHRQNSVEDGTVEALTSPNIKSDLSSKDDSNGGQVIIPEDTQITNSCSREDVSGGQATISEDDQIIISDSGKDESGGQVIIPEDTQITNSCSREDVSGGQATISENDKIIISDSGKEESVGEAFISEDTQIMNSCSKEDDSGGQVNLSKDTLAMNSDSRKDDSEGQAILLEDGQILNSENREGESEGGAIISEDPQIMNCNCREDEAEGQVNTGICTDFETSHITKYTSDFEPTVDTEETEFKDSVESDFEKVVVVTDEVKPIIKMEQDVLCDDTAADHCEDNSGLSLVDRGGMLQGFRETESLLQSQENIMVFSTDRENSCAATLDNSCNLSIEGNCFAEIESQSELRREISSCSEESGMPESVTQKSLLDVEHSVETVQSDTTEILQAEVSQTDVSESAPVIEQNHSDTRMVGTEGGESSQDDVEGASSHLAMEEEPSNYFNNKTEFSDIPQTLDNSLKEDLDEEDENDEGLSFDFDEMDLEAAILDASNQQPSATDMTEIISGDDDSGRLESLCNDAIESNEDKEPQKTQEDQLNKNKDESFMFEACAIDALEDLDGEPQGDQKVNDEEVTDAAEGELKIEDHNYEENITVDEASEADTLNKDEINEARDHTNLMDGKEVTEDEAIKEEKVTVERQMTDTTIVEAANDGNSKEVGVLHSADAMNCQKNLASPVEAGEEATNFESERRRLGSEDAQEQTGSHTGSSRKGSKKNSKKGKGKGKEECKMS